MSTTKGLVATDRALLRLWGSGARDFLQGLVSNDVRGVDAGAVYAAMLSPQGKYLFDFFLVADGADVLIDVKADRAAALAQRLAMYRLRAPITIEADARQVTVGIGPKPPAALAVADPRDAALGWRCYGDPPDVEPLAPEVLTRLRIERGAPESGVELIPDDSYILEMGFERLRGVDFRKGCYVGQEVTARMKHKTELRKGLASVAVTGPAPAPGTEILAEDRPAGRLGAVAEGRGLAYLRFDRAQGQMRAGEAIVTLREGFS
jgi:tRNA-modifying protein YgfZ